MVNYVVSHLCARHLLVNRLIIYGCMWSLGVAHNAGYEGGYIERDSTRSLSEQSLRSVRDALQSYRVDAPTVELLRAALKQFEGECAV